MSKKSIYEIPLTLISGEPAKLSDYKGKKLLIVNVASKCGYTPQYEKLQQLWEKHGDKVVVLGFPANDFMGQEPGTESEISSFCQLNYGVTFPLFSKSHVVGNEKSELYRWLSDKELNGWNSQEPTWNFCKYLIDEKGELQSFYASKIDPMGQEMLDAILK